MGTTIEKRSTGSDRVKAAIDRVEPDLRRRFLQALAAVRTDKNLRHLAQLVEAGKYDEALAFVDGALTIFADHAITARIYVGQSEAAWLANSLDAAVSFDITNVRAVQMMTQARLRLVQGLEGEARTVVRQAMIDGLRAGLNPRQVAIGMRDSLGLTENLQRAVENYRRLLTEDPREALSRTLRDRRFDRTVRRAASGDATLTPEQIDRMVARYRDRAIKYRAEMVARTESLRAVHEGADTLLEQAVGQGLLERRRLVSKWVTAGDHRVRDSHWLMSGQLRMLGDAFISGNGYALRYPGDPSAPASETIHCRCRKVTRVLAPGKVLDMQHNRVVEEQYFRLAA